jgi:hypothetical protein
MTIQPNFMNSPIPALVLGTLVVVLFGLRIWLRRKRR